MSCAFANWLNVLLNNFCFQYAISILYCISRNANFFTYWAYFQLNSNLKNLGKFVAGIQNIRKIQIVKDIHKNIFKIWGLYGNAHAIHGPTKKVKSLTLKDADFVLHIFAQNQYTLNYSGFLWQTFGATIVNVLWRRTFQTSISYTK